MNIPYKYILVLLFIISKIQSQAQDTIIVSDIKNNSLIGNNIEYYEDKSDSLQLNEVIAKGKFVKSTSSVLNFGTTSSAYWLRFVIKNVQKGKKYIEIQNPIIDYAQVYIIANNKLQNTYNVDENKKYSDRVFPDKNLIFPVTEENESVDKLIYIKVKCSEHLSLPIVLSSSEQLIDSRNNYNLLFGIYVGIILVMFFYNLFLYGSIKDSSYLYYITYIISVGLAQASLKGYFFEYIFPNHPVIASKSVLAFSSLTGIFAILFLRNFLRTKEFTPKLDILLIVLMMVYVASLLLSIFDLQRISCVLVDIGGLSASLVIVYTSVVIVRLGYKPARFFLYSWSLFLSSIFIFVLKDFGLIPFNIITDNIIEIGSALEVTVLSLALADRINIFKKEKEESQAEALRISRENEQIIKNQNVLLEKKVEERTKELTNTNNELISTLNELKQTQSQLVNAEKMASLGQLTAGIAHEINNPINFVVSNVKPLKRDIDDIYELVLKYENINHSDGLDEKIKEIHAFRKTIDYDYLKEEITNLLKGIEDGAIRTADIVKGLRVFSRLDENDLKRTNIIEGINSTLTLLNPEISGSMELIKNYSQIPAIECFPGKLNQVFMNILNNAIFAIKEYKERKEKGKLTISTYSDDMFVFISIKDNGIGMTDEVKSKIFEPFFTTKDVGKGTGLGMSITFSIIQEHNGTIELNTEYGKGTEFILKLPINYSKSGAA